MQLLVPWEEASLPLMISVLRSRLRQASLRHLAPFGLAHQQFQAIRALADHPGASHCELAGALGLDRPAATRLIQALVRKGWVASKPHPGHGRKLVLSLTEEGRALEASLAGFRRTVRETLETGFDESERRLLRELLGRLRENLDLLDTLPVSTPHA